MERKSPNGRLVIEQKKIAKFMVNEHKVHINPNKKTVFVKLEQIERGYLGYLKERHNIPLDYHFVIPIEFKEVDVEGDLKTIVNGSVVPISFQPIDSFIDVTFELTPFFLLETLEPFLCKAYD